MPKPKYNLSTMSLARAIAKDIVKESIRRTGTKISTVEPKDVNKAAISLLQANLDKICEEAKRRLAFQDQF
jgi:hypothetical protein